ncbi:hypothetical protein PHYSODRAFT_302094 [Phytophthora sojae]|uniref:Uncharacterized protein n=1 Tax=Phytophthora sojae (strain P6497) TaxID=1094619 RepID=G4ZLZ6_PHYSP|nr:hypothetical protein PHYSODRAFT_302094 [Phytophthora sojae]EGZ15625.1 hypothetical protein PHYSODRAFT_302094 [Phytophthora sojae]|eukprot:XP_009529374.1 hypothetical protein PHYSODRAFT_302094 [Phytophthora sojae]
MTTTPQALLTVGLAVKNYVGTEVTEKTVKEEWDKFNLMCINLPKDKSSKRLNVLIVCATAYGYHLRLKFAGPHSKSVVYASSASSGDDIINEIILLNLSTPDLRAEFFGLQDDSDLKAVLESMIAKVQERFITTRAQ